MCIIENPVDLQYFTGLKLSCGKLLVHSAGSHLFVDGRYIQNAKEQSGVATSLLKEAAVIDFLKRRRARQIGFDSGFTTYDQYLKLQSLLKRIKTSKATPLKLWPLEYPTRPLRVIKDELELHWMRESAKLAWRGFECVKKLLKEGISETEVAAELEIFWKRQGALEVGFEPIIAFGANSAMPHHIEQGMLFSKKGMWY